MASKYEQAYHELFRSKTGRAVLRDVRAVMRSPVGAAGLTLSDLLWRCEQARGELVDAWQVLNALEHLWICGAVTMRTGRDGHLLVETWHGTHGADDPLDYPRSSRD